ncbi:MAG: alanine racemase [Bacteroidales bacterium]
MDDISSPVLVVDEDKCRRNIRHMAEKAAKTGVGFRPHFKTHQSQAIGRWFREAGVEKITVSSFSMAAYFAADGWKDIMVAFPVNIRETDRINQLAPTIRLGILLADEDALPALQQELKHPVDFYVKLDVGSHRTGYYFDETDRIAQLLSLAAQNPLLHFYGFVAHAGHAYHTQSLNEVHKIFRKGTEQLAQVTAQFKKQYPGIIASWGDTPTCSLESDFEGVDEIRPGNFVFYDLMQYHLASCDLEHIAMVVAAPVVARHKQRNEIVLYAGAVHLSKDSILLSDNEKVYGEVVRFTGKRWEPFSKPVYIDRLSQEHGIFFCPEEYWDQIMVGDLLGVIPVHSCLAADLLRRYYEINEGVFLP